MTGTVPIKDSDSPVRGLAVRLRALASTDYTVVGDVMFEAARTIDLQSEAAGRLHALHQPVPVRFEEYSVCSECTTQEWPCATIRAMSDPTATVPSHG